MEGNTLWNDDINFCEEENHADDSSEIDSEIENFLYSQLHHDSTHTLNLTDSIVSNGIVPFQDFNVEQTNTLCTENPQAAILDTNNHSSQTNSENIVINTKIGCGSDSDPDTHFRKKIITNLNTISKMSALSVAKKKKVKKLALCNGLAKAAGNILKEGQVKSPKTKKCEKKEAVSRNSKEVKKKAKKHKRNDEKTPTSVDELLDLYRAEMDKFYNSECTVINIHDDKTKKSDHEWHLDLQDRYPTTSNTFRFFNRLSFITCHNCQNKGHLSKDCNQPKKVPRCYLCGVEGHPGDECHAAICEKCLLPGHFIEHCQWKEKDMWKKCPICTMPGHLREECPDLWRRYYLTTSEEAIVQSPYQGKKDKYCYNCGKKGHFGHECDKRRMNAYSFPTSPFIASYSSAKKFRRGTDNFYLQLAEHKKTIGEKSNTEFQRFTLTHKKRVIQKLKGKLNAIGAKIDFYDPRKQRLMKKVHLGLKEQKICNVKPNQTALGNADSSKKMHCAPVPGGKKKRKRKKKSLAKLCDMAGITMDEILSLLNRFPNGKLATSLKPQNLKPKGVLNTRNGALKKKKLKAEPEVIVLSD